MIVKHSFAGWVGVEINGICANGEIEFSTAMFGMCQLKEHIPTEAEKRRLLYAMRVNQKHLTSHIREAEMA
jgi:hypothetical protein